MVANSVPPEQALPPPSRDQVTRQVLFRSVAAGLMVVLISVGGVLRRLDRQVLDYRQRVLDRTAARGGSEASPTVSIVDCPPEQLHAWSRGEAGARPRLARLLRALQAAGARAVVLDFPLERASGDDAELLAALTAGRVVVRCELTSLEPTQFTLTRPPAPFAKAVQGVGFSLWEPYHDAIVRHFLTTLEGGVELSLPLATWAAVNDVTASEVFYSLFHRGRLPGTNIRLEPERGVTLSFRGPPGEGFVTIPLDEALARSPVAAAADQVVIIGTTDIARGGWTVPLSTSLRPSWLDRRPLYMSSTELTANAIDTLLGGRVIRPLGPIGGLLLAIAFAVGAGFIARWMRPPSAGLTVMVGLLAWFVAADVMFAWNLLSLPLFEPYAAALLSFGLSLYGRLTEQADRASRLALIADEERQRLAELDAAKRAVIGTVVHDLKVPVAIIKGQSVTLATDPDRELGVEVHREFLETIAYQCDRLMHQIEDLLDADSNRPVLLQRQGVDLNRLLDRVVAMHHSSLPNHRISIQRVELPPMSLDPDKIERVLDNLISNAIKYSPDGGDVAITMGLEAANREVTIAVRDWGLGMTRDQQARLFGLFVRVLDDAHRIAGSGIGLYSAKRLVEAHGGRIAVVSAPGEGSTFTVWLPLQPAALGRP